MRIPWAYLKRVMAGAIFGLYMTHLLYFLNPQVEVSPARLLLVTLVYGVICGILFGSVLWGLRALRVKIFGRPEGTWRTHGFGFVVLAAYVSTFIYWMHLMAVRLHLPVGAVRMLSKATNILTVTAFLLLFLWVLERNADKRRSRAIFVAGVVLIVISSFFLYQRRESFRTDGRDVVVANVGTVAGQQPVIVIAIRNLPYDWILTMSGEGTVPFFDAARGRGYFTRVEPFPTTSPKSIWASLATGKLPFRHGVTGRFSYRTPLNGPDPSERFLLLPSGIGFAAWGLIPPVQRISAQLPAGDSLPFWVLFERLSLRASVIQWQGAATPSSSARPALDVARVGERFKGAGKAQGRILEALTRDARAMAQLGEALRGGQSEISVTALDGLEDAQRALHIYRNEMPPRSSMKGELLRAYVEQLDRMIGALRAEFPDRVLIVVSPNGVVPPPLPATAYLRAREMLMNENAGGDDGFLLVDGRGVAHRENAAPVRVVDVVPTILFAAGLPVGRDMDGHVVKEAFDDEFLRSRPLSLIQTYEAKQIIVRRPGSA